MICVDVLKYFLRHSNKTLAFPITVGEFFFQQVRPHWTMRPHWYLYPKCITIPTLCTTYTFVAIATYIDSKRGMFIRVRQLTITIVMNDNACNKN